MPALSEIPGYGAYTQRRAQLQQQELGDLQQASGLMGILGKLQAQQKEQAFRQELSGLGPDATDAQRMGIAAKYASPDAVQRAAEHRISTSEAQEARKQAAKDAALARKEVAEANINLRYDMLEQKAADTDARNAITEQRNRDLAAISKRHDETLRLIGQTRADAAKAAADAKAEAAANKPMTEFQGKAALYGTRAAQSDKVLKALEDTISLPGLAAGQATGMLGNVAMSSEQRRVDQAQRDFVNAVLRQESGAVISDAEFANAKRQYFPMTGDKKPELDQKRANRALAIQGFARMSGPRGAADIKAILDNPLLPGVDPNAKTPQANTVKGGYVETRRTPDGRILGKKADGTIEEIK